MKRILSTLTLILWVHLVWAQLQPATVPPVAQLADITLSINPDARKLIGDKIKSLMQSERHFMEYVSRCDRYFPYIEGVFLEENIPLDFKYLALQESALLPYAVSSSDAVGFWQFKDFTALENNMRVDNVIDQRKNIIASSYGASSYLKKSNSHLDHNWLYTLLSYNLGLTGAKRTVTAQELKARHITLDKNTHQYIIHFLAHKFAFEKYVGRRENTPTVQLLVYQNVAGKSFSHIAKETNINEVSLRDHNYWLLKGSVPSDQNYYFILPVDVSEVSSYKKKFNLKSASDLFDGVSQDYADTDHTQDDASTFDFIFKDDEYPELQSVEIIDANGVQVVKAIANGKPAIIAQKGQTFAEISTATGVSISRLRRYNELEKYDELQAGNLYYLKRKAREGNMDFFTATEDKNLWLVSQRLGIRRKKLARNNRMETHELIKEGRVLWLKKRRPSKTPIQYEEVKKEEVVPPVKEESQTKEPSNDYTSQEEDDVLFVGGDNDSKVDLNATYHIVRTNESLLSISRIYNVTILNLRAWNKEALGEDGDVTVGQKIRVKAPTTTQPKPSTGNDIILDEEEGEKGKTEVLADGTIIHIVGDHEDLMSIAVQYREKTSNLIMWNRLQNLNVKKGDRLIVKRGTSTPKPEEKPTPEKEEPTYHPTAKFHIVQAGDTYYSIAKKYNKKPADLMRWNPNLTPSSLSLGAKIFLESQNNTEEEKTEEVQKPQENTTSSAYHIVTKGETLYSISRKYGVSTKELQAWNQLNSNALSVGQKLQINGVSQETEEDQIAEEAIPEVELDEDGTYVVPNTENKKWHTIQKGETLYSIGRKYNVSAKQLQEWNGIQGGAINTGDRIMVSKSESKQEVKASTHLVQKGETLYSISRKYHITVDQLMKLNGFHSAQDLKSGVYIKIK